MEYISDQIKEDYKQWKAGTNVFITAQTGSGKTTFVLDVLLPYAFKQGKRVLYLVNRTILKNQLLKDFTTKTLHDLRKEYYSNGEEGVLKIRNIHEANNTLVVKTYQELEMELSGGIHKFYDMIPYEYVIADEVHYWINESIYNTSNYMSFRFLMTRAYLKVRIYISATMDSIKPIIEREIRKNAEIIEEVSLRNSGKRESFVGKPTMIEYSLEKDYHMYKVHIINGLQDIVKEINATKERKNKESKWLIFVDSIRKGIEYCRMLKEEGIEAVFIDAKYDNDVEASETVKDITNNKKFNHEVVIATSVLDNGVSIEDNKVNNIVIQTHFKDTFLQMLGRKRRESKQEEVNLYIFKENIDTFQKRYRKYDAYMKFIQLYQPLEDFDDMIYTNRYSTYHMPCQQKLLENIRNYTLQAEATRKLIFPFGAQLHMNPLAIMKIDLSKDYYKAMLEKFQNEEDGENAFVREQLLWLGIREEEIQNKLDENKRQALDAIIKELESLFGDNDKEIVLTYDQNIKFRNGIKQYVKEVLTDTEFHDTELWRQDMKNPFSINTFNSLIRERLKLPYEMSKDGRSNYKITKKDFQEEPMKNEEAEIPATE